MAKRRTLSQIRPDENRREVLLSSLVNFGPVILPEFEAMGFNTFGDLEDLGWEAVCRKWVEYFPDRLNANAFIGVIATFEGVSWSKVSPTGRNSVRRLVAELRMVYGLPPIKSTQRKT